jgi:hypothetical protein
MWMMRQSEEEREKADFASKLSKVIPFWRAKQGS